MQRLSLTLVALFGLTALTAAGAMAAPFSTGIHVTPEPQALTQVDYYWHHHHWHHRHWNHDHWRYYD